MNTTSLSLLERLRQPADQEAWNQFVKLYTPLLYHWARQVGLSPQDRADLIQDVLLLLVRKLPEFTYDPKKSFRSWLRTVTLNKWRENYRKSATVAVHSSAGLEEVPAPDEAAAFDLAEYRHHLIRHAFEAIRPEFPERTWNAFREYVQNGRDAAEVAAELHLSIGTVYAAKSRVLARLRQEIEGLLD
jgi:RNA polymerase sigma-70 factor (ECF subfamily)